MARKDVACEQENFDFGYESLMGKSRRMRWAGHVARMGRRGMLIDY
jgi:hypothetical protein